MGFLFFCCFIVFSVGFYLVRKNSQRTSQKILDNFWQAEYQANNTPKKSIEQLHYITLNLDMLPFLQINDSELDDCYDTLQALQNQKIVNLSGMTNTELKLAYGTLQFPVLSNYDANFTRLTTTLYTLAKRLHTLGYAKESKAVLEYGILCDTDITGHYLLLAAMYQEAGDYAKVDDLVAKAKTLTTPLQNHLLTSLQQYQRKS